MLWNRKFAIRINIENTIKEYVSSSIDNSSLKVDFEVQKSIGGIGETAEITVYGLPLEDIRYFCTSMGSPGKKAPPKNLVQVSAGFPDDYGVIFEGSIIKVAPNVDTPDMSIQLSCVSLYSENAEKIFQYSYYYVTYLEVAKDIASFFDIPFRCMSSLAGSTILKNPSFKCTVFQALDQLRGYAKGKFDIFLSGGELYVTDNQISTTPIRLAGDSGLIGTPKPTADGVNITCILRPSLEAGKFVMVESNKLMMTQGLYQIINLTHSGSNRDSKFYSQITGKKISGVSL